MKLKYFLLLLITSTVIHQTSSIAEVRYVSHEGTSTPPYTTWETAADSIQKTIDICVDGDTVIVANGVYYENLVIDKQLWLIGSSMDSTIIDGSGLADRTIQINADVNIENFKVYGNGEGINNSIIIHSSITSNNTKIINCKIQKALAGIFITHSCLIKNLFINKVKYGFVNVGASNNSIDSLVNNMILLGVENANAINVGAGYYYITNNTILYTGANNPGAGISISAPRKVYIYNNLVSGFRRNINIQINIDSAVVKNNILVGGNRGLSSINDDVIVNNIIEVGI